MWELRATLYVAAHIMQGCYIQWPLCCFALDTTKPSERAQVHLLTAIQASVTTLMPLFLLQRSGTALLTAATSADWATSPTRMWVMKQGWSGLILLPFLS